ncbi:hypothetical protein [Fulvivirga sp.]|uniref:hypothetical protein n=1 Tax=Fulvivirga sp. TaxID=1931237 RepID=UPI0032EE7CB7
MGDNFDKHIRSNKSAFDDKEPSGKVWNKIDSELSSGGRNFNWIWKVAATLFFCSTVYLFFQKAESKDELIAKKGQISEDFVDIESYYFQIISDKRDLIYDFDTQETPIEVDFEQDLQKLDAMYQVLKEELKTNPSKKVVDALILNMLVRIDVLNGKIDELEKSEVVEEEVNTSDDDASV